MIRKMKTKKKSIQKNQPFIITLVVALIATTLSGLVGYSLAYGKYNPNKTPTQNTPGYITEEEARGQVKGFYEQYLHPRNGTPEGLRQALIHSYGTKNLTFYSRYYQHGFDPIVCSTVIPMGVKVKSVQPGAGALVKVEATYPDNSTANIDVTLVLNNEGFGIDTITCPGDKGNLPPKI